MLRTANAAVLPFDWRVASREFLATIADYQAAAGDRFDLSPAKAAAEALLARLDAFHAGITAGRVPEAAANVVIQDLARILVPVNFNRGPRFHHDPALTIPKLPALEQAANIRKYSGDAVGFAKFQLVRGQNSVIAAFRQAVRLIDLVAGPAE